MDHIDQAIYSTVHDSELSAKQIATLMGMSHQVLLNKANAQCESHKLTLREALQLQMITGNRRITEAMSVELDTYADDIKRAAPSLMESMLNAAREQGDVARAIQESLQDGKFTLREREQCQREINEAIEALKQVSRAVVSEPVPLRRG